jgi:hypothetical protein
MTAEVQNTTEGSAAETVVLRAKGEPETKIKGGERRPFEVVDEKAVHLSSTAQKLTHGFLCEEVKGIVSQLGVPVNVALVKARWCWDFDNEERERVVTSLAEGHRFADVKMILGVDYLGNWATIHMTLATEPEKAATPPAPPKGHSFRPAAYLFLGSIVAGVLGMLISSSTGTILTVLGVLGVLLSGFVAFATMNMNNNKRAAANRKWRQEQSEKQDVRQFQRAARTFKDDDLRLFRSAMEEVFKQVVDGIQQRGGEVVQRIEGDHTPVAEQQAATPASGAVAEI